MQDKETASVLHRFSRRYRLLILGGVGLLCVFLAGCFRGDSDEELLTAASAALAQNDPTKADKLVTQYLLDHPDSSKALVIAGQSAWSLNRKQHALDCLRQVKDDGSPCFIKAQQLTVEFALQLGSATVAEISLRRILRHK